MRIALFFSALLLSLSSSLFAEDFATVRIKSTRPVEVVDPTTKEKVIGYVEMWGSAFGVDLSEFGINSKKIMLTCAHNVVDRSADAEHITSTIEISKGRWISAKVLYIDQEYDLAIMEASEDLPPNEILKIATESAKRGDAIKLQGSPLGVPIEQFEGVIERRFNNGTMLTLMKLPFDHGDSGGPVLNKKGEVVGIASQGILLPFDKGNIYKDRGMFIPSDAIRCFLETYKEAHK